MSCCCSCRQNGNGTKIQVKCQKEKSRVLGLGHVQKLGTRDKTRKHSNIRNSDRRRRIHQINKCLCCQQSTHFLSLWLFWVGQMLVLVVQWSNHALPLWALFLVGRLCVHIYVRHEKCYIRVYLNKRLLEIMPMYSWSTHDISHFSPRQNSIWGWGVNDRHILMEKVKLTNYQCCTL